LLAIALAATRGAASGRAGTLVEFPNVSEHPPTTRGYLARPDAGLSALLGRQSNRAGPYPAVIVLHGCSGVSSHSVKIADRLGSWEYVALTVDSLGPRGMTGQCGSGLLDQALIEILRGEVVIDGVERRPAAPIDWPSTATRTGSTNSSYDR
jgi:fermentation-respiration switch protein FrsA (DUF1100 family)